MPLTASSTRRSGLDSSSSPTVPLGQPARVARVPVAVLTELLRRDCHLVGVDDDDEVTGVDVLGELRLVLAAQQAGYLAGEPAQDDVAGVVK